MPDPQRGSQLKSGQVRAEAAVDPAAEGDVAVGLAVPADLIGIGELGLVGVGCAEEDEDLLTLHDGAAADLGVLRGQARDQHHRRLPP